MKTSIVRLWTPSVDLADEIAEGELHGSVDDVRAGESHRFQTGDGLVEILKLALNAPRADFAGEGEGRRAPSRD